jgi:hypothetical protein
VVEQGSCRIFDFTSEPDFVCVNSVPGDAPAGAPAKPDTSPTMHHW